MASRKKRVEALETLYGKRESAIDDEPMILRSPEEYWREYRTYFHIGQAYGISESAAYRNIKWCETRWPKANPFGYRAARPLLPVTIQRRRGDATHERSATPRSHIAAKASFGNEAR
jgi:Helix-turn-helix of DDE superfamily endonuclease